MKKILVALSAILLLSSVSMPYRGYTPVFMKRTDLEHSVFYKAEKRELVHPGKIYYRSPYLFVNERYKGVHVINNSNPANPVNEGFIVAPGCIDMAAKGDVLYIDNAVDLVAFDVVEKKVTNRIKDVFPEPAAPDQSVYYGTRQPDLVIVGWKI